MATKKNIVPPENEAELEIVQKEAASRVITVDPPDLDLDSPDLLIGGCDISFSVGRKEMGCLNVSVVRLCDPRTPVVSLCKMVELEASYHPGFLYLREGPPVLTILRELRDKHPEFFPRILCLDGNGRLHPRKYGIACYVGQEWQKDPANAAFPLSTFGVAKNLVMIDSFDPVTRHDIKSLSLEPGECHEICSDGDVLGVALIPEPRTELYTKAELSRSKKQTTVATKKPIYPSPGHLISLDSVVKLTKALCVFRVPEVTRHADQASRMFVKEQCLGL